MSRIGAWVSRTFGLKPADNTVYMRNAVAISNALEEMARGTGYEFRQELVFSDRDEWFNFIAALYVNLTRNGVTWKVLGPDRALEQFHDVAVSLFIMGEKKKPIEKDGADG